jgi:hypothetical protein
LWIKIPVKDGVLETNTQVWYNAEIDPQGTKYIDYWYSASETLIAQGAGLFTIGASPYTITVPTLTKPADATGIPAPDTGPGIPAPVVIKSYALQALGGAINGTTGSDGNADFTYSATGLPSSHLLFKNGQKMIEGTAYTKSYAAGVVTFHFLATYVPMTLDVLELLII